MRVAGWLIVAAAVGTLALLRVSPGAPDAAPESTAPHVAPAPPVDVAAQSEVSPEPPPAPQRSTRFRPHRPTRIPDRVILTLSGSPARERTVSWRTDDTARTPMAEIAIDNGRLNYERRARVIAAETQPLESRHYTSYHHRVRFTRLRPDTPYVYRVGDGRRWSEWMTFRTATVGSHPFSFIYLGDSQNEVRSRWSRVVRQAYAARPDAAFMLHAGDIVDAAEEDEDWGEWFQAAGWIHGTMPSIVTPGNHEYLDGRLAPAWAAHLAFPRNGPTDEDLTYGVYFVDYQGARFVSLDTQAMTDRPDGAGRQAAWLEDVLASNPHPWAIVFHHHAMDRNAVGREGHPPLDTHFREVFARHAVDLVLQGHEHSYMRTGPDDRDPAAPGPVYVTSVSGPKMYPYLENPDAVQVQSLQMYQIVDVDRTSLAFRAYSVDGVLRDQFRIEKPAHGGR